MATPDELAEQDFLHRVDLDLDFGELPQRRIFAMPRAVDWMNNELPNLPADGYHDGAARPQEQTYELFHAFIAGEDLTTATAARGGMKPPRHMRPPDRGIWELRTFDLRFFGWFWRRSVFILAAVDTKAHCSTYHLYNGYRDQAVHDRTTLGLDQPNFEPGGYDGCFSTR